MSLDDIIRRLLERLGSVREAPVESFFVRELSNIHWRPSRFLQVGDDEYWGIDIFRGDPVPEFIFERMKRAKELDARLRVALLVLNSEDHDKVAGLCARYGVEVITEAGGEYRFLRSEAPSEPSVEERLVYSRLPETLMLRVRSLAHLSPSFSTALTHLSDEYLHTIKQPQCNVQAEEMVLRQGMKRLVATNEGFFAPIRPLEFLHSLEQIADPKRGRDHFFHAFNVFLWGISVIDRTYTHFQEFHSSICYDPTQSPEYIWLLTALFHDVGYLVESKPDYDFMVWALETPLASDEEKEQECENRSDYWKDGEFADARMQLASLWSHLQREIISSPWHPEKSVNRGWLRTHPLDRALEEAFVEHGCHGAASALMLLRHLEVKYRERTDEDRQFLLRHMVLPPLSILFHDRRVRDALRSECLSWLSTRRFPYASLLMYLDSIQEDRRSLRLGEPVVDLIQDVVVEDAIVQVSVDEAHLTQAHIDKIAQIRDDFADISAYLVCDGLRYVYPPVLLTESLDI